MISFDQSLEPLGFSSKLTGGQMARSMMLEEITILHHALPQDASRADYRRAIEEENILGKPTLSSRQKSYRHLIELYGLDPQFALFRVLRAIAAEDKGSMPLMAAICVYCRDPQLRASFELLKRKNQGQEISRVEMEEYLEQSFPERFSPAMKKSLAQNVNTTWTACGHLIGRSKKIRAYPKASYGAACYAIFAGWLYGKRGSLLLDSEFSGLLQSNPEEIIDHLRNGSLSGWLKLRSGGGVTEIDFSKLLSENELQHIHVTA